MVRSILFIAVAILAGPAFAVPESYTIDPRHTFPSFEVNHLGFSTQRGRFNKTTGKILIDREAKKAAVDIVIDAGSVDTGLAALEEHIRKADFLDVEKYPTMTFKSTGTRFDGDALKTIDGTLTIRGQTKPVTLTVNKFICGANPMSKKPQCGADVTATIKRSDFGMTYALLAVGDEVKVLIQVEAVKD